jgi:hypothetical protein
MMIQIAYANMHIMKTQVCDGLEFMIQNPLNSTTLEDWCKTFALMDDMAIFFEKVACYSFDFVA